jgi:hypothetical protein
MRADLRTDASARVATGTDARTDAGAAADAGAVKGGSTAPFPAPTIQVWIKRAASSPAWLSLMMEMRQFHYSFDLFSHCGSFPHMPSVASSVALANLSPYVDGNIVKFSPRNSCLVSYVSACTLHALHMTIPFR